MAVLLKKEILHERVYCGRWKGRIVFFSSSNFDLKETPFYSFSKVTFRFEEARPWGEQVSRGLFFFPYRVSGVFLCNKTLIDFWIHFFYQV